MSDDLAGWLDWLRAHPELQTLLASATLIFAAWLSNWIVKRILVRGLYHLLQHTRENKLQDFGVIKRLSNIVPALVLSIGVTTVPGLPEGAVTVVRNVCGGFIVLTIALALGAVLDIINLIYQRRPDARLHPIKGYLQVVKIVVYAIATILIIATLIDRSPLILLSGLGAMAAVLMLIFQDTLLSLVASVQITSNDLIRVGDWVEMPQLNADGDVIDIALHTVKVQNWDKTITTIPTWRLINESYKNWRGMQESGGRRIKRSLLIDQTSVRFLTDEERNNMRRIMLIDDYLASKSAELDAWNKQLVESGRDPINTRRATNLGTFRAYVQHYLRTHTRLNQGMTQLVRQLEPTPQGLPMEIYCFTNTVAWNDYEAIQSDIFDHLLAILPEFGLRLAQQPTGADVSELMKALGQGTKAQ
ncbi:mechanosensitive ion channel family protein [Brevundimonas sp. UBA5713]|uniref:mechanosensitive ion channel family protein n=1 Tax=Brevundimonas sp. UBA5713 TaxID=1946130 RepID=UPI0025B80EE2|nr:mechanosensitive ion channel family protein [Brevundimonas sp. UBA5713]